MCLPPTITSRTSRPAVLQAPHRRQQRGHALEAEIVGHDQRHHRVGRQAQAVPRLLAMRPALLGRETLGIDAVVDDADPLRGHAVKTLEVGGRRPRQGQHDLPVVGVLPLHERRETCDAAAAFGWPSASARGARPAGRAASARRWRPSIRRADGRRRSTSPCPCRGRYPAPTARARPAPRRQRRSARDRTGSGGRRSASGGPWRSSFAPRRAPRGPTPATAG